jgi:hypothetical protein
VTKNAFAPRLIDGFFDGHCEEIDKVPQVHIVMATVLGMAIVPINRMVKMLASAASASEQDRSGPSAVGRPVLGDVLMVLALLMARPRLARCREDVIGGPIQVR